MSFYAELNAKFFQKRKLETTYMKEDNTELLRPSCCTPRLL
jgi:hypothetical protein